MSLELNERLRSILVFSGADTFCVVADKKIVRVQNIIQSKATNVVKATWLVECVSQNAFVPW